MDLKVVRQINVDFHDSKYISVNAKQYDKSSRFILVTCYNNGDIFRIDNTDNYAYIRYRKPDDLGVFNSCNITDDGKILIELSEQMLAVIGKSYADLVIVNNNLIDVVENTGELIVDDSDCIVSTMIFCINVIESSFDNTEIESSYEYNALNDLLIKATEDYSYVMKACKISETNAKLSEENAKTSETQSKISENNAKTSETNADISEENAKSSELNAKTSEENAKASELKSEESATEAKTSENNAKSSESNAKTSETNAKISETKASNLAKEISENIDSALQNATLSKSYAVGETGFRNGEDVDNAKYYYSRTKALSNNVNGTFTPIGTIKFAELKSVDTNIGYVYHIKDAFITDDTFKSGAGVSYPAGTNVYYTVDGHWDCFVTETVNVIDDDNGNVEIICSYDFFATYDGFDDMGITISELANRIKALEEQSVLEVVG